ncbi:M20 metallopeptidase family protein [Cryobacterium tagatosivorans]|uniref:Amidohydrolase n=1 Tax=Cryobacterium tagatosivorans TaxID=1259199 RepID=A0A4R8UH67_9MICO|nr:M20 family metallopeptidase [Cryobacterium tagatosivorans]TFB52436.1 amidohydrolase [Cryobacterium tagatosivorans]
MSENPRLADETENGSVLGLVAERLDALEQMAIDALEAFLPEAVELRHRIHAEPRLGGDEFDTRDEILRALGMPGAQFIHEGFVLRVGDANGPSIAIRSELDALPIQERSEVPWHSRRANVAHLCGHDVHMAALVAVTRVLDRIKAPVPLLAVFQPREEIIPSGAQDFVDDPTLLVHDIRAMIGVHLQPAIPDGSISAAAGAINAAADNFDILVHGRPAHGAYPHLGNDTVLAAAAIVQSLQQVVARRVDPMNPAVITVGRISGGDSHNAIPSQVSLQGTIRSYSQSDCKLIHGLVNTIVRSTAEAYGCTADVQISVGEPVLRNNAELAVGLTAQLRSNHFVESAPVRSCGADDFAFFSAHMPSLMVFAGTGDGDPHSPGLHHPRFAPDDTSVRQVARVMLLAYFAAARILLA